MSSLRSIQDIEFILALQENPLADYKDIAARLGVTYQTVSRRLKQLRQEKAFRINADLDLSKMDKRGIYAFINVPRLKDIRILEKMGDEHPYTFFRGRYLGRNRGIYMEFSIPSKTREFVLELLEELQKQQIIGSFTEHVPLRSCRTAIQVYAWDGHDWSFDWEGFKDNFDVASANLRNEKSTNQSSTTSNLEKLSMGDLKLLAQISRDAGLKNKELATRAGVFDEEGYQQGYQLSRKIKWLRETFVGSYRLFMDSTVYNIFNMMIFRCKAATEESYRLFNLLETSPEEFPFRSTLRLTQEGFIWFVGCPSSQFSPLSKFLWEITSETELYVIDYNTVVTYPLWHGAFDPVAHRWKDDRKFMVTDVLEEVLGKE